MMASSDHFQFYMERFYEMPKDVKNDIVYCQRSMRSYLKVHQLVADVFKKQGDADPVQKQRILDELEDEIEEINAEQQFLLLQLNESLEKFYKLLRHNGIDADPSYTNKVVSSKIVPFVVDVNYTVCPTNVKVRLTEEALIRKHFLLAPDDQPSVSQMPAPSATAGSGTVMYVGNVSDEDDIREASNGVTTSDTNSVYQSSIQQPEEVTIALLDNSEILVQKVKQVLKIGECEDIDNADSLDIKPDLSDTVVTVSDDDEDCNEDAKAVPTQKEDDTVGGVVEQLAPKLESILKLEPSLKPEMIQNSKPALIECKTESKIKPMQKPEPIAKIQKVAETIQEQTESSKIVESRMNLRQALKRARKTKQQPRVFDEDENVMTELIAEKSEHTQRKVESLPLQTIAYQSEPPPLIPIRQTKSVNSTKSSSISSSSVAAATRKEAKESKAIENDKKVVIEKKIPQQVKQYKTRKLYAKNANANNNGTTANVSAPVNPVANTSGEATTSSSDDSNSEQRPVIRWHPDEPREYRTRPEEYGMEGFLGLLSLYTPAVLSQLQQRRSKRKRRTIHTTERSDFHYGRLEVPQLLHTEVSKKKKKVKTEFLLSPKVKRLQAKKGGSKRSSPEKFEEVIVPAANQAQKFNYISVGRRTRTPPNSPDAKLKCKECRKKTEPLFPCTVCDFMFHQECHEDQGKPNPHVKCPMCLCDEKMKTICKSTFSRHNSNEMKKGEAAANVNGRK